MKHKKGNKLFSLLLAAALVLSMSGTMAFASQASQSASADKSVQEDAAEQDLSFSSSKVSKTTDDAPFSNKLSGAQGKVTYTSSNAKVATVDANGKVTILGVGTVTIKATGTGSASGKTEEASFTLTVSDPVVETEPAADAADVSDEEVSEEEGAEVEEGDEEDAEGEEGDEEDAEGEDGEEEDAEAEDGDEEDAEAEDGDEEDAEAEEGDEEDVEDEDADAEDIEDEDVDAEDIEDADAEVAEAGEGEEEDAEVEDGDEEDLEAGDAEEEVAEAGEGDGEEPEAEDADEAESGSRIATATIPTDEALMTLASYSLAPADKESQNLEFQANKVTKSVDDNPFINPLSESYGELTYDSSDEDVAIVDEKGQVTLIDSGTSIISVYAAGDEKHDADGASYILTVNDDKEVAQPTGDSMNIRVAISWEGDTESMRPEYVEVTLLADGKEQDTVKVTEQADGNWYYIWTDLPVYTDGKDKIEYTVKEINTPTGYTPTYGEWFDEENNTYSIVISDTWGVESDTGGVHGPKTSDIDAAVYSMYLLILASAVIVMLGVRRRTVRK